MTTDNGMEHVTPDRSDDRKRVVQNGDATFHVADRELLDILRSTARQSHVSVDELLERAILNEALIVEQLRIGRRWQVKDRRNRTADVNFA